MQNTEKFLRCKRNVRGRQRFFSAGRACANGPKLEERSFAPTRVRQRAAGKRETRVSAQDDSWSGMDLRRGGGRARE